MNKTLDKTGQAGTEIEITPEMIDEGVSILRMYDADFADPLDQIVTELFSEMVKRSPAYLVRR